MSFFSASAIPQSSWSSLGQLFFQRVGELGCRTFLKIQRRGRFEDKSWRDIGEMVQNTLLGLHELGMAKGDNAPIMGDNSLPWLCADLGDIGWRLAEHGDLAECFGLNFVKDSRPLSVPRNLYRCSCCQKAARS